MPILFLQRSARERVKILHKDFYMSSMKFCDRCGSRMKRTHEGFRCRKCGHTIHDSSETLPKDVKRVVHSNLVYVVDKSQDKYVKVVRTCPRCGNSGAYRWFSTISGEHAGIRRERTIEHFKCTKCSHTWTETA